MALTKETVERWIYPDVRPELDSIRVDVLALLEGRSPEHEEKLVKASMEIESLRQTLADVEVERDALASRVLDLEKELAPVEPEPA